MPFMSIIVSPAIPAEKQAEMAAVIPELFASIKSSPGVKNIYRGTVVGENYQPSTVTKMCQVIEFESPEAEAALKASIKEKVVGFPEPESSDLYEVTEFPQPGDLTPLTQISVITLTDISKAGEAREEFLKQSEGSPMKAFGGKSLKEEGKGLIVIGWDSMEQIKESMGGPKGAAAKESFEKYGKATTILVSLQAAT